MTSLDRRDFFKGSGMAIGGGALLPAALAPTPAAAAGKPVLIKLGTQEPSSAENFIRFRRYGVKNVCGWYKIKDAGRRYPTVEELKELVDLGAKYDIAIDMTDCDIGRGDKSAIMLGTEGRDREIADFQTMIRNCAAAGIPSIKYYLSILPIIRSSMVQGRGDTLYNRWNYKEAIEPGHKLVHLGEPQPENGLTRAGVVSADQVWERMTYFLERVVPVANEYKIKLAQHPHDPPMPPQGFWGVPNVLGTVDGLKHFVSIHESPYHGLNFCQGTVCEMLENPNAQIGEVIRWFGSRKKIFNVHFRNIRGHRDDLVAECFPDDGDVDLPATVQVYREVGYDGMLMPDHIPVMAPDPARSAAQTHAAQDESFTFAYGYIRGLIQTVAKLG